MKKMFSGEVFFALFLLSGVFKESLGINVDLAAVFLVLTTLSILKRIYKNPSINKINVIPIALFFIFSVLIFLSFFYSPNLELTQNKTIKFVLLTTPAFVFPFILFKSKASITRFLIAIASIATIMSLFSLPMIFQRGDAIGFVGFNDGNYLGLARVNGMGLVILLFLGILNNKFKKYRLIFLISVVVVLISLLSSGGRMPIIAVSISLLITIISTIKIKNGYIKYPKYYNKILGLMTLLLIPLVWAYQQGYFNSIVFRFETLLKSTGGGSSSLARTDRFSAAIDMFRENFFLGNGFGSFGDYYKNGIVHDYPHNLFLEILSELGLVGLFVFSALLIVALVRFIKLGKIKTIRNDNLFIAVAVVFLVIFINAMVSGDFNGNRILFTFISIICLLPIIFKDEVKEKKEEKERLAS